MRRLYYISEQFMKITSSQCRKIETQLKAFLPIVQIRSSHYYDEQKNYDNLCIDCLLSHKVEQRIHDSLIKYIGSLDGRKFSTQVILSYNEKEFKYSLGKLSSTYCEIQ